MCGNELWETHLTLPWIAVRWLTGTTISVNAKLRRRLKTRPIGPDYRLTPGWAPPIHRRADISIALTGRLSGGHAAWNSSSRPGPAWCADQKGSHHEAKMDRRTSVHGPLDPGFRICSERSENEKV
jgi:hypothetical protein